MDENLKFPSSMIKPGFLSSKKIVERLEKKTIMAKFFDDTRDEYSIYQDFVSGQ